MLIDFFISRESDRSFHVLISRGIISPVQNCLFCAVSTIPMMRSMGPVEFVAVPL